MTFEMQSLRAAVKNNVYSCSVCITLIFVLKFDFDRVFLNVGPPPPWLKKKKKKMYIVVNNRRMAFECVQLTRRRMFHICKSICFVWIYCWYDDRDIRDRSILRLFETDELQQPFNFQSALPISLSQMSFLDDADHVDLDQPLDRCNPRLMISSPLSSATWDELSYFSEPEFDSDYRPQHVHKSKVIQFTTCAALNDCLSVYLYMPMPRALLRSNVFFFSIFLFRNDKWWIE